MDDLFEVVDQANQQPQVKELSHVPQFLGGHSMGGLVATHAALHNQRRWSGLLLLSPAIDVEWTPMLRWDKGVVVNGREFISFRVCGNVAKPFCIDAWVLASAKPMPKLIINGSMVPAVPKKQNKLIGPSHSIQTWHAAGHVHTGG